MSYTLVKGRFLITASDSDETPEIPLQGSVSFTPTAQIILDNEEIYADSTIVAPLDKEGYLSYKKKRGVSLLTPDPGQTNPESFTYKVDFNLHYGREKYTYRTFYLDLPYGSSEVNLADHIPVKESGTPSPEYVTQGRGIVSITRDGDGETATILFTDGESSELSLPRGLDAKTPNFSIGEVVESTTPSADLQVSPSGDYILNLSLPKGSDGSAPENPTFRVASVTSEPYGSLPDVHIEGEYPNLQLHFSIPSGADGSPGVTKEDLEGTFALNSDVDKKLKQISVDTSPFKAGARYYSPVTYYWPDYYKNELSQWSKVLKFGDSLGIVILNRNSGDWESYDQDFHTQGQLAKGAGAKRSIFYVKTQYGAAGNPEEWGVGVPNADKYTKEYIIQELDYCRTHYPDIFDGVFLDEFINGWGAQGERLAWYNDLVDTIRARYGPQFLIVGNCGSNCSEDVLALDVDVFMSYESTADKYIHEDTSAPIHPAHMAKHPGTRFWHVVHDVTKENYLQVFEKAENLGIGHLYITDGKLVMGEGGQWKPDVNPYAVAPSQWIEDVFTPWVKGVLDTRLKVEGLDSRVALLESAPPVKTEAPAPDLSGYATKDELSNISTIQEVSGTVTLDTSGPAIREFYTSASTTFTANSEKTVIARAKAVVWMRDGNGVWAYKVVEGWTVPALVADTTRPVAGTLNVVVKSATSLELKVTGASDDRGLHATPYSFSLDSGATWTPWQASATYTATGLTTDRSYSLVAKVRDTVNLEALTQIVTATPTVSEPTMSTLILRDTFTRPDGTLLGSSADTGQKWEGALGATVTGGKMKLAPGAGLSTIKHGEQGGTALFAFDVTLPATGTGRVNVDIPMTGAKIRFMVVRESTRDYVNGTENLTGVFNNGNGDPVRNPWAVIPNTQRGVETTVQVKAYLQSDTLTIYVGPTRILAYTLKTTGSLTGSLELFGDTYVLIDNVEVKKL